MKGWIEIITTKEVPKYTKLWSNIQQIVWRDAGDHHSALWLFIVNDVLGSFIFPARVRTQLLRIFIPGIHPRAIIRPKVIFKSNAIQIGAGTVVSYRTLFDNREGVQIGEYVSIGADCMFLTSDHDMSNPKRRSGTRVGAPIRVHDGSRIAVGSTVMRGVTIGPGAVIGAGSIVLGDVEEHSLYVGIPARKKKDLPTIELEAQQ
ncbi:MAG: acyltransferase [Gordonia sp. (in: high G+C Gram-positive bacteria)]